MVVKKRYLGSTILRFVDREAFGRCEAPYNSNLGRIEKTLGNMKNSLPAVIAKVMTMRDGAVRVVLDLRDIAVDRVAGMFTLAGTPGRFAFRPSRRQTGNTVEPRRKSAPDRIIQALTVAPLTHARLQGMMPDMSGSTFRSALSRLCSAGKVRRIGGPGGDYALNH